ncbi:hypothetical protein F8388_018985 [Cannabis sativa]|uniref:TF-B3 domain-containing protein n=1 Tax=Cannabis sativa TaxID=3483 RepID=A0A7J6H0R3_CANSA|nr:hypothetical protein F8388_018985 [Cannabis sativa]
MDNFPTTVPHFLTSSTSTSTTSSSTLIHSKQPKIMAATTTTTTHDDSHNSHFISSNYTSPQFCYAAPTYWGHQDHQGRRHQFPAGSGSVHQPVPAHRSGMAYHPFMMATGRQTSGGGVLVGVSEEQERRLLDAWTTKVARSKRRMARQRSLNLVTRQSSPPPSSSTNHHATSFSTATTLGEYTREQPISGSGDRDLYTFCTPDKKRLRILLKKELKNSDVGSLGRIVLPKREAEEKLPTLSDKEGIQVVMRDVYSNREWSLRYKYWSNNKSRMYVLENTGEFVKQNGLEIGDSIALYEDECKNLYISMKKGTKAGTECSPKRHLSNQKITVNDNNNLSNSNSTTTSSDEVYDIHNKAIANSKTSADHENSFLSGSYDALEEVARDEEDVSLALLIEQLNHKEQQEANTLDTTLSHIEYGNINDSSSISYNDVVISCSEGMHSSDQTKIEEAVQPAPCQPSPWWRSFDEHFEDCYGGLDTLPEVGQYEYYGTSSTLFDHRFMSDN